MCGLVLVYSLEHSLVYAYAILLAQVSHPLLLKFFLIVSHNKLAHVLVCLRSLELLAVYGCDGITLYGLHLYTCLEYLVVHEGVVALLEDALHHLDANRRVVKLLAQRVCPSLERNVLDGVLHVLHVGSVLLVGSEMCIRDSSKRCP